MADKLTDTILDVDVKQMNVKDLLLRISINVDRNAEEFKQRFSTIDERLEKGDATMTTLKEDVAEIKTSVQQLDCKRPVPECKLPERKGTGFIFGVITTVVTIGAGVYAALDSLKPYWEKIAKLISIFKGN